MLAFFSLTILINPVFVTLLLVTCYKTAFPMYFRYVYLIIKLLIFILLIGYIISESSVFFIVKAKSNKVTVTK